MSGHAKRAKDDEGLQHRELIDAVPAIVWRADPRTLRFTFVSSFAEVLLGYPAQRWIDEPTFWRDHLYPQDREFIVAHRCDALKAKAGYDLEYRMVAADGRVLWVRDLSSFVPDGRGGEPVGFIADLSAKRAGKESLSETKLWLRQVIDTIPQQIWSGPADGSVDFVNARVCSERGVTLEELQGDGWQKILHPADRDGVVKAWNNSIANGTPYESEHRLRTAGGTYRWFLSRGVPLRDENGGIVRWYGATTDIELQKQAQDALRSSEQRWRAVFDNASVGVALLDSTLHFVAVNAAFQEIVGYSPEELHSKTCLDLVHDEDLPAHQVFTTGLLSGQKRFDAEQRYRRKNGSVLWAHVNGSILSQPDGADRLWVVMVEDITERKRLDDELERERGRLRLLLDLTYQFIAKLEVPAIVDAVLAGLHQHDRWELAAILLPEAATGRLCLHLLLKGERTPADGATIPVEGTMSGKVYRSGQPLMFRSRDLPDLSAEFELTPSMQEALGSAGMTDGCLLPLRHGGTVLGVLCLATRSARDLTERDIAYVQELAQFVAAAIHNAQRFDEVTSSREKVAGQRNCMEEQVRTAFDLENIIGRSKALREVLQQAKTVAATDSAVLILGETGTGKELIARAIHDHSPRHAQPFIKIDCSAIPAALLESELFGHERGAFTGAIAQKLGRFEIADRGTLFLDEIGDLPLELQTKLLRVLQDQTFERLGSVRTRQIDVRVIAATNRDLERMVSEGEFRADLYYRLKVFPILIPPLRDRRDDIPPLVWHYLRKYAHRMRKEIETIPAGAMEVFMRYPWPGNVRELQHFIERSVVLSSGKVLKAPLRELEQVIRNRPAAGAPHGKSRTMEEIERETILQALRESNWVVGGPQGAAAKLQIKRTTLASRMERLGISRPS